MAAPTKDNILTGEYSLDGSMFVVVPSKSTVDGGSLEYSLDGSPTWTVGESGAAATILKVSGVSWASIGKIAGVSVASIGKFGGVSTS